MSATSFKYLKKKKKIGGPELELWDWEEVGLIYIFNLK